MKCKILIIVLILTAFFHCFFQTRRISVEESIFVVGSKKIWINGANTPWDKWNDFGHKFDSNRWDEHFSVLNDNGINCTRVWISCDGDNESPGINSDGYISEPSQKFWDDVDILFKIAKKHKVYLMIALISFDHSKPGNTNADFWQKMYKSIETRESFVNNYAIPFVRRYKNNPYFFAVDVGNELEWAWENHKVAIDNVLDLIARVANCVHQESKVLVCQGLGAGPKYNSPDYDGNCFSDSALGAKQNGAYIDFYNIHCYDWQIQWFGSPFDKSPSDYNIRDKPSIIGELPAKGVAGYTTKQCYEKAFNLGWQGIMPWTSNGVDNNGDIMDIGKGSNWFKENHPELVYP